MTSYVTKARNMVLSLLLMVIVLIILFPFFWMLTTSFKARDELTIVPPTLLPRSLLYFDNYIGLFKRLPFARYLINSFFLATISVISTLFVSSLAAFGLAKYRFPGRDIVFFAILGVMMLPFQAIAISLYQMVSKVGLINSYLGVFIPMAVSPFGVFLLREAMNTIPNDYIESAQIEGCSDFIIFLKIVLPNCRSALAALAIIKFLWTWNEFFWPLLVINSPNKFVVTMGLARFVYNFFRDYHYLTAASVVSILPILLVFIVANKGMVKAVTMQGLKM